MNHSYPQNKEKDHTTIYKAYLNLYSTLVHEITKYSLIKPTLSLPAAAPPPGQEMCALTGSCTKEAVFTLCLCAKDTVGLPVDN